VPRSSAYNQLGIGDCGHVVSTWPQLTDLLGRNPRVNCEDCLREQFKVDPSATFFLVKLAEEKVTIASRTRSKTKKKSLYLEQDEALF